jgi:hypothetical protein
VIVHFVDIGRIDKHPNACLIGYTYFIILIIIIIIFHMCGHFIYKNWKNNFTFHLIVHFVDIGRIDKHHCLNFLFITQINWWKALIIGYIQLKRIFLFLASSSYWLCDKTSIVRVWVIILFLDGGAIRNSFRIVVEFKLFFHFKPMRLMVNFPYINHKWQEKQE